jgi:hypothetical protein
VHKAANSKEVVGEELGLCLAEEEAHRILL